jgi:serine/threonine protein kinase
MLTKSGAKLLDFGLAKLKEPGSPAVASISALPTVSGGEALTAQGVILGTLQYMAPEQLEGREADTRSDIFSFGVVLYEMLTGKKAFEGKSQASVIAAILEREPPPVSSLKPMTPPLLDHLVRGCLAKDAADRWQTAHDVAKQLRFVPATAATAGSLPEPQPAAATKIWIATTVLFLLTTAVLGLAYVFRPASEAQLVHFTVSLPEKVTLASPWGGQSAGYNAGAISPDGKHVAFTGLDAEKGKVPPLRSLDRFRRNQTIARDRGRLLPILVP